MKLDSIAKRFRIDRPDKFRLSDHDAAECCGLSIDKSEAKAMLAEGIERLSDLQERLYAGGRWSVLIVLQAMDAAGKDSVIKHVLSGINPQGCEVHSFKQPSQEELQHDFLWRVAQRLPTNGRIGIFNRSHYEEVLTVRVHKELLARQKLPKQLVGSRCAMRQRKSCCSSSALGCLKECTSQPCGLMPLITCLMMPSLPAASIACSTISTDQRSLAYSRSCNSASRSIPSASMALASFLSAVRP